ncbi:MAG: HIT family protein [Proteobacteria bacterium]|nr:HIT family protein [Pseudomonadota bacterium]
MSYDPENIFAKILRGEIPCHKVYEDDYSLAFMDIMPQAVGHTLVIPKEPAITLFELSDAASTHLIHAVQRVGAAVKLAMGADGIVVMQLNGVAAGQTVDHVHFHVIPGSVHDLGSHAAAENQTGDLALLASKITQCVV